MPTLRLVATPTRRSIIELCINGSNYRFLIDTGATHTILSPVLIPTLSNSQKATSRILTAHDFGGITHGEMLDVRFNFVGVYITSVVFHLQTKKIFDQTPGLIGQDILQQFKSVTFDNVRRVVRFEV